MSTNYVIRCKNDHDLLWSNDEGFTESDNFEVFSSDEIIDLDLPMEGELIQLKTI